MSRGDRARLKGTMETISKSNRVEKFFFLQAEPTFTRIKSHDGLRKIELI